MENRFFLKVILEKKEEMVYFSQKDLVWILERALRRTELPLYYTKGFNPHVKLSFKNALKLGKEGEEEVIIYFLQKISPQELKDKLLLQLPSGLNIKEVSEI